eukprot:747296-Hanusia_phi.AAC.3
MQKQSRASLMIVRSCYEVRREDCRRTQGREGWEERWERRMMGKERRGGGGVGKENDGKGEEGLKRKGGMQREEHR